MIVVIYFVITSKCIMNSTLGLSILYPLVLAYMYIYIYMYHRCYIHMIYIYIYIYCVCSTTFCFNVKGCIRVKQLNNMKEIIAVYMGWKTG